MGLQDREWARLGPDDFDALYGAPAPAVVEPLVVAHQPDALRRVVWTATAVLVIATGLLVRMNAQRAAELRVGAVPAYPRGVVFGTPGTNASAPDAPGGTNTVCTEQMWTAASGRWRCLAWSRNTYRLPTVSALPYDGTCAHAQVDQQAGRWTCLSASGG